ncbi:MAG: hypothetical protein WBJ48_00315, partial [Bacteroidales bacterium]
PVFITVCVVINIRLSKKPLRHSQFSYFLDYVIKCVRVPCFSQRVVVRHFGHAFSKHKLCLIEQLVYVMAFQ